MTIGAALLQHQTYPALQHKQLTRENQPCILRLNSEMFGGGRAWLRGDTIGECNTRTRSRKQLSYFFINAAFSVTIALVAECYTRARLR
jgi:hypothetical protein